MHLVFCGCFKWEHGVEIHSAKPTLRDKALTFLNSSGQLSYTSSNTIGFKHQQQMTSENPYLFRMSATSFPEVFVCKYTLVWPKGTSRGLYDIAKQAISMSQVKICYMKFHFQHIFVFMWTITNRVKTWNRGIVERLPSSTRWHFWPHFRVYVHVVYCLSFPVWPMLTL